MRLKEAILLCLFLSVGYVVRAQKISVNRGIILLDSLIKYNHFDEAEKRADSLYRWLSSEKSRKSDTESVLEVKLRQAVLFDRKQESIAALELLLDILDNASSGHFYKIACQANLNIALAYEKTNNFYLTDKYLDAALKIYQKNKLEELYSTYCVRRSSYFQVTNQLDSALFYANSAKQYAEKYDNEGDLKDTYMLLSFIFSRKKENIEKAIEYATRVLRHQKRTNDYENVSLSYINISNSYIRMSDFSRALVFSDSAYLYHHKMSIQAKYLLPKQKYRIFDALGKMDSAYHYFKLFHADRLLLAGKEETAKTKELEERYQNAKKEATIQNRNQLLALAVIVALVVAASALLVLRQNRKIRSQNTVINRQMDSLQKILDQKQVLLKELQHRVKNNLQHVISILEIQKESIDFSNIDELVRENQNRIHSMALLHTRLNSTEDINLVNLREYLTGLSGLVKDSYGNHGKGLTLSLRCAIEHMTIEKALPVGLILVELISNSIKHAFAGRDEGTIAIAVWRDDETKENVIHYKDNGKGFDFNLKSDKGLGQEIIQGLIGQLNGRTETSRAKGFELIIFFN